MRIAVDACAAAMLVLALPGATALAGGLPDEHLDDGGSIFFGVVKDTRGVAIADARVSVSFKNVTFITRTDVVGAYRIGTTTDRDQSEITCSKDGYRQASVMRRTPPGVDAKMPVEVDCTLQRASGR